VFSLSAVPSCRSCLSQATSLLSCHSPSNLRT